MTPEQSTSATAPPPALRKPVMTSKALVVLVTGVSGSGKTSAARQLEAWQNIAVSLDGHEGLCYWADREGNEVQRPPQPSRQFLESHDWRWRPQLLEGLLVNLRESGEDIVWCTGIAANSRELAHLFDLRILLHLDKATMQARLSDAGRTNDFGRAGDTAWLAERFDSDQQQLRAWCDTQVDATLPVSKVAEELLLSAAMAVLQRSGRRG